MNLRQQSSSETTPRETPWYQTPEIAVSASGPQAQYQPEHAERILARAGALQELQGKLLSRIQIEVIAAEIGIRPEFVQLAMTEEKAGVPLASQQSIRRVKSHNSHLTGPRIAATIIAHTIVAASFVVVSRGHYGGIVHLVYLCIFPLLLAFIMGVEWQSRRQGAVAGLAIALTYIATDTLISISQGMNPMPRFDDGGIQIYSIAITSSTLLGLAGAQARRIVSHARAAKRKKVNRKP